MPRISKRTVDALGPGEQFWDSGMRGFGVRRRTDGAPAFVVKYRAGHGRRAPQRFLTLGTYGEAYTPDQARRDAKRVLGEVAAGKDPASDRAVHRRAGTVATIAEEFKAAHAEKWRASTVSTNASLIKRKILPAFGNRRPNDVKHLDVVRWHVGLAKTPGEANRALSVLSSMMSWAIKVGMRDAANPCRGVARYRGRKIERYLSAAELARLGEVLAVADEREPFAVAALRLLIFTGARLGEILGLRWEWVDLDAGMLKLPDSKTGSKAIYLNTPARDLLAKLPRVEGNPHVIVGSVGGASLVNLEKPWRRLRAAADLNDVRIHDLRHSFASVAACMGEGLPIIGKLLGHRNTATTARYAHLSADPLRAANEKVGARIFAAMTGTESTDVGAPGREGTA